MTKFSREKPFVKEEGGEDRTQEEISNNNIDHEIISDIQPSPALSPIQNFPEKSPEINSMNNTANNKFFSAKPEINNDSALSSFHIHNINNSREKLKIPKEIREKTIKIPTNDSRLSTNNKAHSKNNSIAEKSVASNKDNKIREKNLSNSQISQGNKPQLSRTENNANKMQLNSLSLSESKDRIINQPEEDYPDVGKCNNNKKEKFRKSPGLNRHSDTNEINFSNDIHIHDFSKSGTFKSESNDDRDLLANNKAGKITHADNQSDNNYDSNSNFYANNNKVNKYTASNYSNFYTENGKKFSETISSLGRDIRNNDSYLDYRKNLNENKSLSNLNVNTSSLNVMIKRDLHEYLSNLENKHLIRLNTDGGNEWVLQFNDDMSSTVKEKRQDNHDKKYPRGSKREDEPRVSTAKFESNSSKVNKKIDEE